MQWYKMALNNIENNKNYSHKMLIDELRAINPGVSDNTYNWAVSSLTSNGDLIKTGYNSYVLSLDLPVNKYSPNYSESSLQLIKLIQEKYPYIQFTVFETVMMNEFLNHLIAQNTIFLQVEKESSIYVFRFLQEIGFKNIMYKPSKRDFEFYWSKDCVVITDLISEAPLRKEASYSIMLEKLLVDILADKLIASTFNKAELTDVFKQAEATYLIDKAKIKRYAKRRNKYAELTEYLEEV